MMRYNLILVLFKKEKAFFSCANKLLHDLYIMSVCTTTSGNKPYKKHLFPPNFYASDSCSFHDSCQSVRVKANTCFSMTHESSHHIFSNCCMCNFTGAAKHA